jgi:GNAT superfamily N-acetyltransferase
MTKPTIKIRPATLDDLDAVNRVIEAAIMTWNLPERVKRLSLPSYRYNALDFEHLQMAVAVDADGRILGVAGWEPAEPRDCPAGKTGLLLHGLYVDPAASRQGIGARLLDAAASAARNAGMDGLLVKAQEDAVGFFLRQGLRALPVEDRARHYANRLWKELATGHS